ncbi:phospholipase D family protein [Pseudomonas knackmussii]|uniref:phospholipase D family protein n=1 Tax=Pseudomonas knackmussii TaxID=65741 RepID=UPI003F49B58E
MQILDNQNDLARYLGQLRDKKITVVSAFAAGTEALVQSLRDNGNRLDIVVGTINSFTSPDFIEFCIAEGGADLTLHVDFRYQKSIHWKLYLVEPDIVILGSANFTEIGVSLTRDNAVVIQDAALYQEQLARVAQLKATEGVLLASDSEAFDEELETYRFHHRRMQAGLARTAQYLDGESWLGEDSNQSIPLFIWYSDHSEDSESAAESHLRASSGVDWDDVREFFTYECAEGALPYEEGDVVLTARCNGSHIAFFTFDRILYRDGTYYIYSYRKKRYTAPFNLDDTKEGLRDEIPRWYEEGRTEMNRADILRFMI